MYWTRPNFHPLGDNQMRQRPPSFALLIILIAGLACSLPSRPPETPTLPAEFTPEVPAQPTNMPSNTPAPPTADVAAFEVQLIQALTDLDFSAVEAAMGDAFAMQYSGSDGGLIATSDAINLL